MVSAFTQEMIPGLCQSLRDQYGALNNNANSPVVLLLLPTSLFQFLLSYVSPDLDLSLDQELLLNVEYLRTLFLGLSDLRLEGHIPLSQIPLRPLDLSPFLR